VFSIYLVPNFISGLGGLDAARDAVAWFRRRVIAAGHPGLHLQAIMMYGKPIDDSVCVADIAGMEVREQIADLEFDSVTYYQYVHAAGGEGDYTTWSEKATAEWEQHAEEFPLFFPHVSVGWDNTQRYPSQISIVEGSSPEHFARFLRKAKNFLDERPAQLQLVTINSWNEWTEGSYLLPDKTWGYRYLEAIREVFSS
jgi:hypothetical protein